MVLAGLDQLWLVEVACMRVLTEFTSEWSVLLVLPIAY